VALVDALSRQDDRQSFPHGVEQNEFAEGLWHLVPRSQMGADTPNNYNAYPFDRFTAGLEFDQFRQRYGSIKSHKIWLPACQVMCC